ncbi:MAG: PilZ domain-containing protein [Candidatus Omnitrophica bacterium]|nr:PilZ domain-containing protein [Candidatus Omnitrophota bacterium]
MLGKSDSKPTIEDIQVPTGVKLLRMFYGLLFFGNVLSILIFGGLSNVRIAGNTIYGYEDVCIKLSLALFPLAIFYFGFIKFYLSGCFFAILYQLVFLINAILSILNNIFHVGNIKPLIQIVKIPNLRTAESVVLYSFVDSLNVIIGAIVLFYLTSKIRWYINVFREYKAYNDRLQRRYRKEVQLMYSTGTSAAGKRKKGISQNISRRGIKFMVAEPLQKGIELYLELTLPNQEIPIDIKVKVVWFKNGLCGARFLEMNKFDRRRLRNFLQR